MTAHVWSVETAEGHVVALCATEALAESVARPGDRLVMRAVYGAQRIVLLHHLGVR